MELLKVEEIQEVTIDRLAESLLVAPNPKHRRKKGADLYDCICAFDIETTNLKDEEIAFCYSWAFQFGLDTCIVGRTIDSAVAFFRRLSEKLEYSLLIYVHNLSFEFQFLKGVYQFDTDSIFATDPRKILKCTMFDNLEFRCSYFLTNMGLAKFLQSENVEHQKLSGEIFDYSKIRYPWTPLTDYELEYQINDVRGLVEGIYHLMYKTGDSVYTIPLTNTGYVRRDARAALREWRFPIIKMLPDVELYTMLRRAFRGGNTHASRFRAGHIEKTVHNIDIASSYPAVQLLCKYPMKPFTRVKDPSIDRLVQLLKRGKALIFRAAFWDLCIKDDIPVPYVGRSKCFDVRGSVSIDNGRVLFCEYCELYLTDIDFEILREQYQFDDIKILQLQYSTYGYLPDELREVTMQYFRDKTSLKGVDDYFYMKAKNRLNSVYGMSAQDPCRDDLVFSEDGNVIEPEAKSIAECLKEYAKNPLMPYQWGVWVTAHARKRLQMLIDLVPYDRFCYCDTDSVKYTGAEVDFSSFNDAVIADSEEHGFYAFDRNKKKYYIGVAEHEADYQRFATLGAKKYVYEDLSGELHITVAGVNKKVGAKELARRGGIEAFKEGFTFEDAGGTESVYNDHFIKVKKINGHELVIMDNVCIKESTYRLGLTDDYRVILSEQMLDSLDKKELL